MIEVSIIILCLYVIGVLIKHKQIPISLSSTYYSSNKKPWFTITMLLVTALMMISLLDVSEEKWQWLVFISCMGNVMCAVAPNFKEELEGKIHYTGAIIACIISQIWCELYNHYTVFMWMIIGIILLISYIEEKHQGKELTFAFWVELICFSNIYFTYYNIK